MPPRVSHGETFLRLVTALTLLPALAGCGGTTDRLAASPAPAAAGATAVGPVAPADLAGHQFDRPDPDRVLIAGKTLDLSLPTGRVRFTVNGPATEQQLLTFGRLHT